MKVIIALFAVFAIALATPVQQDADKEAVAVKYENDNIGVEGYNYNVETSNGISVQEHGVVENPGAEDEAIAVRGSFSYTAPDGKVYHVSYVADRNGYQPEGEHIPRVEH